MDNTKTIINGVTFEHNGFKCKITQRPDLHYLYKVHGYRKSDNMDFLPHLMFEQNLTFEQIRDASISIIDGTFEGKVEVYGNYSVFAGD